MPKAAVYNTQGDRVGEADLSSKVFDVKTVRDVVYQLVVAESGNARKPIAHTKTRGEVSGSGKKPWKQKGTGRARAGSVRSPIWRHGGITFGPRSDRNYAKKVNRPQFRKGLCMILTQKLAAGELFVIDSLQLSEIKTKAAQQIVTALKAKLNSKAKKLSFVLPAVDKNIMRSLRNVQNVNTYTVSELSVQKLLSGGTVIVVRDAVPAIEKIFSKYSK